MSDVPTNQLIANRKTRRRTDEGATHQVVVVGELGHGGALATGDDERVNAGELLRLAHLHSPHPDPPQRCANRRTRPAKSTNERVANEKQGRGGGIGGAYRPCARCRSPAARGRPPPPLPLFAASGRVGLVAQKSELKREAAGCAVVVVDWWGWLVTSRGMEREAKKRGAARRRGGGGHTGLSVHVPRPRDKLLLESKPSDRRRAVRPRRRGDPNRPFVFRWWGPRPRDRRSTIGPDDIA